MKREPHRPRLLNSEQTAVLENRVLLSRELGFSLTALSTGWQISKATLHRYKSTEYRDASVEYARRSYLSYRKSLLEGECYRCYDELEYHARCAECTILLHIGSLFGDTMDGRTCTGCEESRQRQIHKAYEELTT